MAKRTDITISERAAQVALTLQGLLGESARLEAEVICGAEVSRDLVAVPLALAERLAAELARLPRVRSARPEAPAEAAPEQPPLHVVAPDPQAAQVQVQAQELAQVRAELAEQREQLAQVLAERDQLRQTAVQFDSEHRARVELRREAAELDGQLAQVRAALARVQGERDALAEIGTTETQRAERAEQQLEVVRETSVSAQREAQRLQAERDQAQRDLTEVSEEANRLRAELTAARSQRTPVLAGVPVLEDADEVPEAQVARVVELAQSVARRERVYQASDDGGEDAAEDLWARVRAETRRSPLSPLAERDQLRQTAVQFDSEHRARVELRREAAELDGQLAQVRAALARVQGERDALAEIGTTETQRAERAEQQLEVVRETSVSAQREAQRLQAERDQAQRDLTEVSEEANRLRAELTAARSQRTPVLAGVPTLETADEVPEAQLPRVAELAQAIHRRDHVYQAQDDGGDESAEDLWGRATLGERLATLYEVPAVPPPPPPAPAVRRLNGTRRNGVATHARPGAQP